MKFICNACTKQGEPCILDVGNDNSVTLDSLRCVLTDDHCCKWEEFKGNQPPTNSSQSVTNCNRLPKLTAEVFNRPDCPEWAEYAAVDENGMAVLFEHRPTIAPIGKWWDRRGKYRPLSELFDASDWQNSLVERPAKALPDWCKVGEWLYYPEDMGYGVYLKISEIKRGFVHAKEKDDYDPWQISYKAICEYGKQARLRPYNAEEMQELVGKIICETNASHIATTCIHHDGTDYLRLGIHLYDAEELISKGFTIDGKPCAILEHLEEGEWVK